MKYLINLIFSGLLLATLTVQAGEKSPLLVSFQDSPRFPVFPAGEPVMVNLEVRADEVTAADEIAWSVHDYLGAELKAGSVAVPGGKPVFKTALFLEGLPSGYFEVRASLKKNGATLPRLGSRPPGMATFGIRSPLEWLPLASPAGSRFGIQGTTFLNQGVNRRDAYNPYYSELGIRWVNVNRTWHYEEPDHAGQYREWQALKPPTPWRKEQRESDFIIPDGLAPLICQYTIPTWNLAYPAGFTPGKNRSYENYAYPAKDYNLYRDYLEQVARNSAREWTPHVSSIHYKIGWEPDWHWKGSDAEFLEYFAQTAKGIRAGDPQATILGPSYALVDKGAAELERLLPLGLADSLDGIDIHGYFITRPGESGNPFGQVDDAGNLVGMRVPEHPARIEGLRKIKALMQRYMKPGAPLFQTEWGPSYWPYKLKELTPEILRTQAAYNIRGHLVFLGEGCDVTYFFHATDHADGLESSGGTQGLSFNLSENPTGGATRVSPKPNLMGAATLTRVLEGTRTLGVVDFPEPAVAAYCFQRGPEEVVALWSKDDRDRDLVINTGAARIRQVDFMGNITELVPTGGRLSVRIGKFPLYLLNIKMKELK